MSRFEELVLILWNKGELIQDIAREIRVDKGVVEDIIECEANYKEVTSVSNKANRQGI